MGMSMANSKCVPSSFDDGSSSSRRVRLRSSRFFLRSNSMPVENDDEAVQSPKSEGRKPAFRLSRPRLRRRSRSMPVESSSSSDPSVDGGQVSEGGKRTRKRISLNLLRKRGGPSATRQVEVECESKDSKGGSFTEESDEDSVLRSSLISRTRVVAEATTPTSIADQNEASNDIDDAASTLQGFNCATAILRHSYLENMCGVNASLSEDRPNTLELPEDPTVQESIECIFASQLENGLELWDDDEEAQEVQQFKHGPEGLVSPAAFQQSLQNRSDRSSRSISQNKQRYQQASLVYVGTFDPTIPADNDNDPLPCTCAQSDLPSCHPKDWPQAPLLLRPSPGTGTRVKGVRRSDSQEYLWEPGSHLTWQEALANEWGRASEERPRYACCEKCAILPINNGNEDIGKALLVDFESDLFQGSLLLRLRYAEGTTPEPYNDSLGYFRGMNRRYQAVIRGRFKKSIPLTELVTGFQFKRPCGKLPAKWVLRGGMKVISFFAPQLDAKLEGDRPYCLTPLGSTPQSVAMEAQERDLLDGIREEPKQADRTLLGSASVASASVQRARTRKKAFDKLYVQKAKEPRTDPSKVYTFEFLQHLFNFQDFSIELGSMLGSVELEETLDGQPLQIMAAHGEQPLFSFDVWHECLWDKAQKRCR